MAFYGLSVIQIRHRGWRERSINTQLSSDQSNISDENEIKYQKRGEQFLFSHPDLTFFENFYIIPRFLNRKKRDITTNAVMRFLKYSLQVPWKELEVNILTISGVIIASSSGGQNRGKLDY